MGTADPTMTAVAAPIVSMSLTMVLIVAALKKPPRGLQPAGAVMTTILVAVQVAALLAAVCSAAGRRVRQ